MTTPLFTTEDYGNAIVGQPLSQGNKGLRKDKGYDALQSTQQTIGEDNRTQPAYCDVDTF